MKNMPAYLATLKRLSIKQKSRESENEMRMNDVRNDSEWYDQSHVKYQRISWVAEAG